MTKLNASLAGLSENTTLKMLRGHMEQRFQRSDFDLLDWADADAVAEYILSGLAESDTPDFSAAGATVEEQVATLIEVYLNGDKASSEVKEALTKAIVHASYESTGEAGPAEDGLTVDYGYLPDGRVVEVYYDRSELTDENAWPLEAVAKVKIRED